MLGLNPPAINFLTPDQPEIAFISLASRGVLWVQVPFRLFQRALFRWCGWGAIKLKNYIWLGAGLAGAMLLNACGSGGGACSKMDMRIVVEPGFFTNDVSVILTNTSNDRRQVTVYAKDPEGNASTVGPIAVAPKGTAQRKLGPLMKTYGSTQAELERNGAEFKITSCQ